MSSQPIWVLGIILGAIPRVSPATVVYVARKLLEWVHTTNSHYHLQHLEYIHFRNLLRLLPIVTPYNIQQDRNLTQGQTQGQTQETLMSAKSRKDEEAFSNLPEETRGQSEVPKSPEQLIIKNLGPEFRYSDTSASSTNLSSFALIWACSDIPTTSLGVNSSSGSLSSLNKSLFITKHHIGIVFARASGMLFPRLVESTIIQLAPIGRISQPPLHDSY